MITKLIESFTIKIFESLSKREFRKRLFIQECRYNLSLLSVLDWKNQNGKLNSYIIPKLKTEFTETMLHYHENDIISDMKKLISVGQLFLEDGEEGSSQIDIFTQIINKIYVLKVIVNIPEELKDLDRSNYPQRISNLRKILIEIVKVVESDK